ncbi:AAA family ATPase [Veillonella parvula]|uniref:AAA family ATPase n=1 Tax=Veillonella parvula TaxID=29466 RepID=UPI003AB7D535
MLIQFSFKNFRSFRDEAILDLTATTCTEFPEHVRAVGGEKLLPVAAIFGANASGKSNVYNAFEYMTQYVLRSFSFGDEDIEADAKIKQDPFLFDMESVDKVSVFEVYFTIPGDDKQKVYNYGFSMNRHGIEEEWLNSKARTVREYRTIFYRNTAHEELDLSGIPKASQDNIKISLEPQTLIVSLGAKLKIEKCKLIRDWFGYNSLSNFADPIESLLRYRMMPKGFVEDKNIQDKVVNFLGTFDDSIKGFSITEHEKEEEKEKRKKYSINTLHVKKDSDTSVEISLGEESAGTQKMFALYPELQSVLTKGAVLFVDELNARLHPLLMRNILLLFLNPEININHAQLIFTTHDLISMTNRLLRRDEIWFTKKDIDGASELYSLADFKGDKGKSIRKDVNYVKQYLLGSYGAIPLLKDMDFSTEK